MVNTVRVLHKASEDRYEISPIVRFLVDEDRVKELTETYERIARENQKSKEQGEAQ